MPVGTELIITLPHGLHILAGGDPQVIWQGLGYSGGEEEGSGKKGITADSGTSKHDQVPLGSPLCSGNPNIGVDRISRKRGVTDVDQNRGHSSRLGTKGLDKCVMHEAEHKAGPRRWRGVLSPDLGLGGFRAKGRVRGAWSGPRFCGDFSKGRLLLTLFLARRHRCNSRGDKVDRGSRRGREWGGGNRGWRQISRRILGSHLALFQGVWCQSANVRGGPVHDGVLIARRGGGEKGFRKTGGRRDIHGKWGRADCGGRVARGLEKVHEAIDGFVKAMIIDSHGIRSRRSPKGHGRPKKGLEGGGEGKVSDTA